MNDNVVTLSSRRRLGAVVTADAKRSPPPQKVRSLMSSPEPISFSAWMHDERLVNVRPFVVQTTICTILASLYVDSSTGETTLQEARIELELDLLRQEGLPLNQFDRVTSAKIREILRRSVQITQVHESGIVFLVYTIAPKLFVIPRQP